VHLQGDIGSDDTAASARHGIHHVEGVHVAVVGVDVALVGADAEAGEAGMAPDSDSEGRQQVAPRAAKRTCHVGVSRSCAKVAYTYLAALGE